MAVLIEKHVVEKPDEDDTGTWILKATMAILPSGKILVAEGYEESKNDIEGIIEHFGSVDAARVVIDRMYSGTVVYGIDLFEIEDPQEAGKIIQESGLKEAGQKEEGSSADIARMLEEEGLK